MITALAIGIPAAILAAYCAVTVLRKHRDDDPAPFNWQGTVPAAPGHCSCGAPHAVSPDAPFPGDAEARIAAEAQEFHQDYLPAPAEEPPADRRKSADEHVAEIFGDRPGSAIFDSAFSKDDAAQVRAKLAEATS